MVSTRRKDSAGTTQDLRLRTRRSTLRAVESESSSGNDDTETEEGTQQGWIESKPARGHILGKGEPQRRRRRRRNFGDSTNFSPRCLRANQVRTTRISLEDRHTLSVYSRRMHDDSDAYNGNDSDEDELFSTRRLRRHLRQSHAALSPLEKRTALSLRPIGLKSYADSPTPHTYNTDEDTEPEKELAVRATRKKAVKRTPLSWLADDQMPKVGYPNLDEDYSEEEREAGKRHKLRNRIYGNASRPRRRPTRSAQYFFKPKTRRSRLDDTVDTKEEGGNEEEEDTEENEQENKENDQQRSKAKKNADGEKKTVTKIDADEQQEGEGEEEEEDDKDKNKNQKTGDEEHGGSTESDGEGRKLRTRNQSITYGGSKPKRKRKMSDSSSSSEVNRYQLRKRPKRINLELFASPAGVRKSVRIRKRFQRMIKSSSSSSSDSSDSEDMGRKPTKYNNTKSSKSEHLIKTGSGSRQPMPILPEKLDDKLRFSSVGGLDGHVQCLREMILLPMMYPEVFKQFHVQPPRGVLFHGPPGTGKTLIARALASECCFGSRKVSFFIRKGADLLSKWVGESEKQLRLLFEQAQELRPSIIFFDELDGLAPVRSSQQDQIHASIVSTLLALMDGIDNRGEVIIIGATNRIDAIDPALRRPGRFDRELFFPLPGLKEREQILNVHVSQWAQPPATELLSYLAENAVGYSGSDLRALCTEAVIQSFRRIYPQVYLADHRLLLDPLNVKVDKVDFLRAKSLLVPASHRVSQGLGRKLLPILEPVLTEPCKAILNILKQSFPHGLNPALAKVKLSAGLRPAQLILVGDGTQHGQTLHLAPALLHQMEHINAHRLDLATLHRQSARSPEEACVQVFHEARRNLPSIIYVPNIDEMWMLVSETVKAIFLSQLTHLDPNVPILILATANTVFSNLPLQIQSVFSNYRREVFQLEIPTPDERENFFRPLLIDSCLRKPKPLRTRVKTPPPLPRAPTPPPSPLSESEALKLYEQEERTLCELRIFLRDMCKKLASNRLFFMFTKPVNEEEVPDYTSIIKQPMDLETMMTKVDFHKYECARDFLDDIDLIVQNALEYNPARTSADKQIRHRACSLRDYARTMIQNEMDSDFEEKCRDISEKRRQRKYTAGQYLPSYIYTQNTAHMSALQDEKSEEANVGTTSPKGDAQRTSPVRRRRRISKWQRGQLSSWKRKRVERPINGDMHVKTEKMSSDDESKENNPDAMLVDDNTNETEEKTSPLNIPLPLNINCDNVLDDSMKHSSPLQSPNNMRKLSDLLSPSELLDDPLEFDEIDKALTENVVTESGSEPRPVDVSREELEKLLGQVVRMTQNSSLQLLLDLYNQLSRIVRLYARTFHRRNLPKELRKELSRYKTDTDCYPPHSPL